MSRRRNRRNEERRLVVFLFLLKLCVVIGVFAVLAYYSYEVGIRVADGEITALKERLTQAEQDNAGLRQQQTGDRAALAQAQQKTEELHALYEQTRPSDDLRGVLDLIRSRLSEGIELRRIQYAIKMVQNPHDCETALVRRVQVRTPRYRGPEANIQLRLGDQATLSVAGSGGNGGLEEWFDRDQPVRLHVVIPGSRDIDFLGKLPLDQSVAMHGYEFHIIVSPSATRGFVEVNSQRCDIR